MSSSLQLDVGIYPVTAEGREIPDEDIKEKPEDLIGTEMCPSKYRIVTALKAEHKQEAGYLQTDRQAHTQTVMTGKQTETDLTRRIDTDAERHSQKSKQKHIPADEEMEPDTE